MSLWYVDDVIKLTLSGDVGSKFSPRSVGMREGVDLFGSSWELKILWLSSRSIKMSLSIGYGGEVPRSGPATEPFGLGGICNDAICSCSYRIVFIISGGLNGDVPPCSRFWNLRFEKDFRRDSSIVDRLGDVGKLFCVPGEARNNSSFVDGFAEEGCKLWSCWDISVVKYSWSVDNCLGPMGLGHSYDSIESSLISTESSSKWVVIMGFGSSLGGSGGEVIEAGGLNRIRLPDCGDPIFCDVIMGGGAGSSNGGGGFLLSDFFDRGCEAMVEGRRMKQCLSVKKLRTEWWCQVLWGGCTQTYQARKGFCTGNWLNSLTIAKGLKLN